MIRSAKGGLLSLPICSRRAAAVHVVDPRHGDLLLPHFVKMRAHASPLVAIS
jgi:hypothetical protein